MPSAGTIERIERAKMYELVSTCKDPNRKETAKASTSLWKDCGKNQWRREIWGQVPTSPGVWLYLFLGDCWLGLGAPFWYNAVTGLTTNIRNAARGTTSRRCANARCRCRRRGWQYTAGDAGRCLQGFRARLRGEGQKG